VDWCPQFWCGT